ncbi:hypothetical protein TSAR_010033 [Trichomalopsis sarcophagae]|uniref:deoxyribose-phosphate aldolase n=1 Tax=Trichomalopsis sarcophagae TaxID=543379 RepID=A0A232EMG2_9HYME|nr:hypothetical protein TSAR_010033 [Trichomalopsis sarcophagae]
MTDENPAVAIQIEKAAKTNIDESQINNEVKKITDKANTVPDETKLELLLRGITHLDLTSLKGGETFEDIKELCQKAVNAIDVSFDGEKPVQTAAVCVFPASARDAIKALNELNSREKVKVASVAADFPAAQLPLETRLEEIRQVVDYGVDEVDIVINRKLALAHKWKELYDELTLARKACGKAKLKTILATGDLPSLQDVYTASFAAMLAGSDFIKTSTGKEAVNATLPVGVVMSKAIRDYHAVSGKKIGFKPAGGIKTSEDIVQWLTLIKEELGNDWLTKDLFRIGASSVLDDIIKTVDTLKS